MAAVITIQELGKDKPRVTFDIVREALWAKNTEAYAIRDAAFSPDGSQLAVAADGLVTVYDAAAGKKLFQAERAAADAKGDPRILFDGKVIDGATGKQLQKFDPGAGLILSRDGKYLVRLLVTKDPKKLGVEVWSLDNDK